MKNLLAIFLLLTGSALLVPFGAAQDAHSPATVTGKWHFVLQTEGGERNVEAVFQQDGNQVTGKWGTGDVKGTFSDGKLNLDFSMNSDEAGPGKVKIKGQLTEEGMTGDWAFNDYTGQFKATRAKE